MIETIRLSENAVAVLRFEIKGWRTKDKERRLPAYRELAAAGIMQPVPGSQTDYRFTSEGWERREELLEEACDRIDRERYEPPDASNLSETARELLRACIEGPKPDGDENNRPAYRELVEARIMVPMGSFTKGDECVFQWTYWGFKRRFELVGMDGARADARR
jgi:hypothetical protein